ncbi:MAG: hypothetical protein DME02_01225 [Candidatus Rokuibacteriota bacterium]|nr:MAG: hypothetical protein DME02_01225 [Candidatus Rokubacteria bacterium]
MRGLVLALLCDAPGRFARPGGDCHQAIGIIAHRSCTASADGGPGVDDAGRSGLGRRPCRTAARFRRRRAARTHDGTRPLAARIDGVGAHDGGVDQLRHAHDVLCGGAAAAAQSRRDCVVRRDTRALASRSVVAGADPAPGRPRRAPSSPASDRARCLARAAARRRRRRHVDLSPTARRLCVRRDAGGPSELHFAAAGMLLALGTVLEPRPMVHRDPVTGLPASLEFNKMMRHLSRHYALACVAIDDFRSFRQEQGAEVADRMLRRVAQELAKIGGGGRVFYLMRDHQFAVVFRHKSPETAASHLDVVRRAVEHVTLDVKVAQPTKSGQKAPVIVQRTVGGTISAGIAEPQRADVDLFNVLRDAEDSLRRAQHEGMNRIVVHVSADASSVVRSVPEAI